MKKNKQKVIKHLGSKMCSGTEIYHFMLEKIWVNLKKWMLSPSDQDLILYYVDQEVNNVFEKLKVVSDKLFKE